ncbi:MAG: Enolase [Parcubacteria group bacterium GW2011_GWA2_43_17]|nr:MAG: Enolase [Parcubacteria group bacterium GW2011_GWA2_43_17]KKT92131.1 MAG: Enolase [Parcubacteria group bacterium GW2011_GWF2_45_11]KKT97386.1 MAG: Enolase [Parcubacteria group bacterium GW2011_GWC2_45_15]OGY93356.1 MAG: phosphopyruvate hydratase [Candidatus Komeilibacteria bacterium RIFOXYA2_FULL_45_9]OGY96195.1 MAG: phosphopyruvate hydratase [Candidatus Komeilibacteria bacterium RIFOXYC2_FULL_45_12]HAH04110.1 phosphopyruvate hydratase [Candidatus Komeilibacteria bacterium]
MADKIKQVYAGEILDSRGNPTLEVTVTTEKGIEAKADVPSGASIGSHEALELRDGDIARYGGKGVLKAITNVNTTINEALRGQKVDNLSHLDQRLIDLDGTPDKSRLGANAVTGVSIALARAMAQVNQVPVYQFLNDYFGFKIKDYQMPMPLANIINGGKHADSNLDIQEFLIIPEGIGDFNHRVRALAEVYHALAKVLVNQGYDSDVGDEGGYAPDLSANEEALQLILKAIEMTNYRVGQDIYFGLDAGASTFYDSAEGKYKLDLDKLVLTSEEMIEYYKKWLAVYPFSALEDPLAEDDWPAWKKITDELALTSNKLLIIGDDLFTTSTARLQQGLDQGVANSVLVKPNQIGTLTETINCIKLAQANKYEVVISHRSGETEDSFIADLAVGTGAAYIKTGAPARSDRVAKYNRLIAIEAELNRR